MIREYGVVAAIIVLGIVGYVFYDQNRDDVLDYSLDVIGNQLIAMVDDAEAKEAIADRFRRLKQQVLDREVAPQRVEYLAANVMNLRNRGSKLTSEEAQLVLDLAVAEPPDTLLPEVAALPRPEAQRLPQPVELRALGERLNALVAFNEDVQRTVEKKTKDKAAVAKTMRFKVQDGLHVTVDPEMMRLMSEEEAATLAREMAEMEKKHMLVWKKDLAQQLRREQEHARAELEAALQDAETRKAFVVLKNLEVNGLDPAVSDSLAVVIEKTVNESLEVSLKAVEQALREMEVKIEVQEKAKREAGTR